MTIDHIEERQRHPSAPRRTLICCASCNMRRGSMVFSSWVMTLGLTEAAVLAVAVSNNMPE